MDDNGAASFEFVYRNHRHLGFSFAFVDDQDKPVRLLTSQIIGDIDLGQKLEVNFGENDYRLYTIPDDAKVSYQDGKFTSDEKLAVENYSHTPQGTLLILGLGDVMNYTHYTEPSYYMEDNRLLTEEEFDTNKLSLMTGTSQAKPGEKRVAGILFSLFGKSIHLQEIIKPGQPSYKIIESPIFPTTVSLAKIDKPQLKVTYYQFKDPDIIMESTPLIDYTEESLPAISGSLQGVDYLIEENDGLIIEESYDSPLSGMSGYTPLLFEMEDSRAAHFVLGGIRVLETVEDSIEMAELEELAVKEKEEVIRDSIISLDQRETQIDILTANKSIELLSGPKVVEYNGQKKDFIENSAKYLKTNKKVSPALFLTQKTSMEEKFAGKQLPYTADKSGKASFLMSALFVFAGLLLVKTKKEN